MTVKRLVVTVAFLLFPLLSRGQQEQMQVSTFSNKQEQFKADSLLIEQLLQTGIRKQFLGPDSILPLYRQAYHLAAQHQLIPLMARSMAFMATGYAMTGDKDRSKILMDSALALSAPVNDRELSCTIEMLAANMYQGFSDYRQAVKYHFSAMRAFENPSPLHSDIAPRLYNNFGTMLSRLGGYNMARPYYLKAEQYLRQQKIKDSAIWTSILMNIGGTYVDDSLALAIRYFETAATLIRAQKKPGQMHLFGLSLSIIFVQKNELQKAHFYLDQATAAFSATGPELGREEFCRGKLLLHEGQCEEAIRHLDKALQWSEQGTPDYLGQIYKAMALAYAEKMDFDKAYHFQSKAILFEKEYVQLDKNIITDLLLDYQASSNDQVLARKELEIAIKDRHLKEKNVWIGLISGGALVLSLLFIIFYKNYKNKQQLEKKQLHNLVQLQEISRLQAAAEGEEAERVRIAHELHDGVMVRFAMVKMKLTALPVFSETDEPSFKEIIHHFDVATNELRQSAHNLMPYGILEDGLAQAVFYFCKSMQESSGLNIAFQQIGDPIPRISFDRELILYRIIQELVNNAIKYALATQILVQLSYNNSLLSITVEDNGNGFDTKAGAEGFGLKGIRNRVLLLKGKFSIDSDADTGTTAYLELDLSHEVN